MSNELVVITASANPAITLKYWSSWRKLATSPFRLVLVVGGEKKSVEELEKEVLRELRPGDEIILRKLDGVIPAFLAGVESARQDEEAEILACFHDDLEILEEGWDERIKKLFASRPNALLAGFGGGTGLGSVDIYDTPYSPFQLARQDFVSNMRGGEAHGRIGKEEERVACLDGFSQVGRKQFVYECYASANELGIVHHAYDSLFGGWCRKAGGEAWMIPVECNHAGGVTAVANEDYQRFAAGYGGDGKIWEESHRIMYEEMRGILPFSVKGERE